jgi:hypothetical protein
MGEEVRLEIQGDEQALVQQVELPAWVPPVQTLVGAVAPLATVLLIASHYNRAKALLDSIRIRKDE